MNIEKNLYNKEGKMERLMQKVFEHSKEMRIIADSSKRKCVDGGYKEDEAVGAMAIPGADLGVSMALLKIGYSPQESFDLVRDFLSQKDQPYCWHTDTHEGHDDCVVGCGHCNTAIKGAEYYGLKSDEVEELLRVIKENQEREEGMEMIVLNREHLEQGVLVVNSSDYTVKPWNQEKDTQYFIYDKTRHKEFLKELVGFAKSKGKEIDYDVLMEASDEQTNATLGLLNSSKGKPMYSVDVSGKIPEIKYLQDAPVIEE